MPFKLDDDENCSMWMGHAKIPTDFQFKTFYTVPELFVQ
jgi:hypothetical protein